MGGHVELEPWAAWSPSEIAERLDGVATRWAIAGGWAIDLFAGEISRAHDDLEVVVGPGGFGIVQRMLGELEWFVVGDGQVTAIEIAGDLVERTWQTWGWDPKIRAWRIDVMREPWTERTWRYRRNSDLGMPLDDAIRVTPGGIPYLSPELVLLFKAKHRRKKDEGDFDRSVPLMEVERVAWLIAALEVVYPSHPWLTRLRERVDQ